MRARKFRDASTDNERWTSERERERERGASLVRFRRALGASSETLADIPLAVARATVFRFRDDDAARAHARLQHIVRIACLFRDPGSREESRRILRDPWTRKGTPDSRATPTEVADVCSSFCLPDLPMPMSIPSVTNRLILAVRLI